MSIRNGAVAIGLFFMIACSGDGLTQPDDSTLRAQAPLLSQGASGAIPGTEGFDLESHDGNEDGTICIKTVPEGKGKAGTRTIIRDNKDGECPGGFEEVVLAPSLEPCDFSEGIPASNCDCEAAGGVEFGGLCYPGG